jgi:hypothetical protein
MPISAVNLSVIWPNSGHPGQDYGARLKEAGFLQHGLHLSDLSCRLGRASNQVSCLTTPSQGMVLSAERPQART